MANKNRLKKVGMLSLIVLVGLLSACQKQTKKTVKQKKETVIVAKLQTPVRRLYYNGTLAPLSMLPVLSPVNGRVEKLMFEYGQNVLKDQPLAVINSEQLAESYRKAISDYLQKKHAYVSGIDSFQGTQLLYRAGVVTREAYLNAEGQQATNLLSFYQSRFALEKILKRANIDPKEIEKLTIEDTKVINRLLQRRFTHLLVKAKTDGIALFPLQQTNNSNGAKTSGKLIVGSEVKLGQLMLTIGNMTGLTIEIKVSEVNINRIKTGMKVTVTSEAFPGVTLHGVVTAVSSQAQQGASGSSGLSMFLVKIRVAKLTAEERKVIRVGMTAKVEISIKESPKIMLPIKAVQQKKGNSVVTVIGPAGKRKEVTVLTGETSPAGKVTIISGVKAGDKVVVHD